MDNKEYISRQIAVYKTDKKLIEFNDKLNPASSDNYAHIHAKNEKDIEGKRIYSNIGITIQDYTNGTGDNIKRVTANISADEAQFIYSRVFNGVEQFEFTSEKIFGNADEQGYSTVTKLTVRRSPTGSDGKPRLYAWCVQCENGKGKPQKNKSGGTYCQSGSYKSDKTVFININDLDFFKLMNRVNSFINIWETHYGTALIEFAQRTLLSEKGLTERD